MSDLKSFLAKGVKQKSGGTGVFVIPTGPGGGTTIADGSPAGSYEASWTEITSSTSAALLIIGCHMRAGSWAWGQLALATGAASSEVMVAELKVEASDTYWFVPPIPIAASTRLSGKFATDNTSYSANIHLICINQTDVIPM